MRAVNTCCVCIGAVVKQLSVSVGATAALVRFHMCQSKAFLSGRDRGIASLMALGLHACLLACNDAQYILCMCLCVCVCVQMRAQNVDLPALLRPDLKTGFWGRCLCVCVCV